MEMEAKLFKAGKSSTQIELQTHVDTLRGLLQNLKNNNQSLCKAFEMNGKVAAKVDVGIPLSVPLIASRLEMLEEMKPSI